MSPYNFERTYDKWKKLVFHANILIATLSLATEVGGTLILYRQNLIKQTIPVYMLRYLIIPAAFNYSVILAGFFLMKKKKYAGRRGDYIPLIQLLILCTSDAAAHHIFPIVVASLCFPIFVSSVFDNPKMTRNIWLLSHVGILAVALQRKYDEIHYGTECEYLAMDTFVAVSLTLAAYITCRILTRFQSEKKQIMEEMHQYELQLQEELNKEPQTKLYNASAFRNKLYRETEKSRFTEWPLMLLILDIDDFKQINVTYGHARGDKVLERIAEVIKKHFKEEEFPSRYGGEKFTILVREGTVIDLKARTEALRRDFASQTYAFMEEPVTVSAGIAEWKKGMTDEKLLDCADKALYRAKEMGRDRTVVWCDAYEKQ
ncbi:MAG: GGDEF domain-containing protein [Lachnospiraceae bacterium]|nr:GGDEF domain-containing protein [Lachnospiraceae bacterium]